MPEQKIEIKFTTRLTPCGCTVTLSTPTRTQVKRYRNGYGSAEIFAKRWIEEQIAGYREHDKISGRACDGLEMVFFVNGRTVDLPPKPPPAGIGSGFFHLFLEIER